MALQKCEAGDYVGKVVPLEYAIACGEANPSTLTFVRLGALTVKSFEMGSTTTSSQTDTDSGGFESVAVTGATYSVTGDGKCKKGDDSHRSLALAYAENLAGEGLRLYTRLTFPDITYTAFCIMTTYSRNADTTDFVTFSTEFMATESIHNANIATATPAG